MPRNYKGLTYLNTQKGFEKYTRDFPNVWKNTQADVLEHFRFKEGDFCSEVLLVNDNGYKFISACFFEYDYTEKEFTIFVDSRRALREDAKQIFTGKILEIAQEYEITQENILL